MRNKKSIITAALIAPMLALTGGFALAACWMAGSARTAPPAARTVAIEFRPALQRAMR
jgi:hypothetical protein